MKTSYQTILAGLLAAFLPLAGSAQVNSGSDGHDGALNPASNLVIDMADHPDGIYHYTSVNIPAGVTVSFIPNAGNKPVVWLVQGSCVIDGTLNASALGQIGGPGGFAGGNGGPSGSSGQGPGGGAQGSGGGYATRDGSGKALTYGNSYILPLIGGSGSGGLNYSGGFGGGGGGAMLIAASNQIAINGWLISNGYGSGYTYGSGGALRLVCDNLTGSGLVDVSGGSNQYSIAGGSGRIRFDVYVNNFHGNINPSSSPSFSQGFQPIILPAPGQGIQLAIQSIGGVAVAANPSGVLVNPDVIVPAQQTNPVSVVVKCTNVPLNSEVTVVVQPANGAAVQAVGLNNAGTAAASTATISLNMPRGGGIIYAKAVTGLAGSAAIGSPAEAKTRSLAETGWTAEGERFAQIEITAAPGAPQRIAYITESGKRYEAQ